MGSLVVILLVILTFFVLALLVLTFQEFVYLLTYIWNKLRLVVCYILLGITVGIASKIYLDPMSSGAIGICNGLCWIGLEPGRPGGNHPTSAGTIRCPAWSSHFGFGSDRDGAGRRSTRTRPIPERGRQHSNHEFSSTVSSATADRGKFVRTPPHTRCSK